MDNKAITTLAMYKAHVDETRSHFILHLIYNYILLVELIKTGI